jgi:hypothetical protein
MALSLSQTGFVMFKLGIVAITHAKTARRFSFALMLKGFHTPQNVRLWPKADILATLHQFLFLGKSDILRMFATRTYERTVIFGSLLRLDAKGPHRRSATRT